MYYREYSVKKFSKGGKMTNSGIMADIGKMYKGGNKDKIKFIYSIHARDEYGDIIPKPVKKMSVVRVNQTTAKEVVYKKYPSKDYFVELENAFVVIAADGKMAKGGEMAKGGKINLGDVVEVKEPNYGRDDSYYVVDNKAGYDKTGFLISPTRNRLSDVFEKEQLRKLYAKGI